VSARAGAAAACARGLVRAVILTGVFSLDAAAAGAVPVPLLATTVFMLRQALLYAQALLAASVLSMFLHVTHCDTSVTRSRQKAPGSRRCPRMQHSAPAFKCICAQEHRSLTRTLRLSACLLENCTAHSGPPSHGASRRRSSASARAAASSARANPVHPSTRQPAPRAHAPPAGALAACARKGSFRSSRPEKPSHAAAAARRARPASILAAASPSSPMRQIACRRRALQRRHHAVP